MEEQFKYVAPSKYIDRENGQVILSVKLSDTISLEKIAEELKTWKTVYRTIKYNGKPYHFFRIDDSEAREDYSAKDFGDYIELWSYTHGNPVLRYTAESWNECIDYYISLELLYKVIEKFSSKRQD